VRFSRYIEMLRSAPKSRAGSREGGRAALRRAPGMGGGGRRRRPVAK